MTAIRKAISLIGVEILVKELKVTQQAISKAKNQRYGSPDWFPKIVELSGGEITFEQLHQDRIDNK